MANTDLIKSIRYKTNLSFSDISKAIAAVGGENEDEIITYLKKQGVLKSAAKQGREASNGSIFSYVHELRIGVLLEIKCESDFVARGQDFQTMGQDILLHIAAYQPKFISSEQVDQNFIDTELKLAEEKLVAEGKDTAMISKILDGKKGKMAKELSLLTQEFLKDPSITVADYIGQNSAKCGEKIEITRFCVYNLNE
jgi:elongation factor Ts